MNSKWESIRSICIWFFCIFGLVSCHGVDQYFVSEIKKLDAVKAQAESDRAKAQLELERLRRTQGQK